HLAVEPEGGDQSPGQVEPDRVHRMVPAEVIARYCLVPHQLCAAAHDGHRIGQAEARTNGRTRGSPGPTPSERASPRDSSTHRPASRPTENRSESPHS